MVTVLAAKRRHRILLVEDDLLTRRIHLRFLHRLGYPVDTAANGREAVEAAAKKEYDFVFMDVQMPVMDGFEATRELRKLGPRTPYIVAITGSTMAGDRQKCIEAGMDDYLPKPVRLDALARKLEPPPEGNPTGGSAA